MTMGMQALSGLGLVYIILIFCRCILNGEMDPAELISGRGSVLRRLPAAGRYRRTLPRYGTAVPG